MSCRAVRLSAVPPGIDTVPLRTRDPQVSPVAPNPAGRLRVLVADWPTEPVGRTTLSPARMATAPSPCTVTPALTVASSPAAPVSVAVAVRGPLLDVLTANVIGPPVVVRV